MSNLSEPSILALPFTSSSSLGVPVPIPTSPSERILSSLMYLV